MDWMEFIELIIGAFFVILYSYSRFKNDENVGEYVINSRYIIAIISYILLSILIYLLMWIILTLGIALPSIELSNFLNNIKESFKETNVALSTQMIAALIVIEGLPRIKMFATVEKDVRILFQRIASLSSTAQSLSHNFQIRDLDLNDHNRKELKEIYKQQGLSEKYILEKWSDKSENQSKHNWTRISLLWISFKRWKYSPNYKNYIDNHEGKFKDIENNYINLSKNIKYCFQLSDATQRNERLKKALSDCSRQYSDKIKSVLREFSDFASCVLLNSIKGEEKNLEIKNMGFKADFNKGISVDLLTLMFIAIMIILTLGFGLSEAYLKESNKLFLFEPKHFIKVIMIASIYCICIVCALMAKKACDRKKKTDHGWATYFFLGITACFFCSMVSITTHTIINDWNLIEGYKKFAYAPDPKWPWQIVVFSTTFLLAALLNWKHEKLSNVWQIRFFEATILAVAITLTFLLAGILMRYEINKFISVSLMIFIVGFSIGFTIPNWYRKAPKNFGDDDQKASEKTDLLSPKPYEHQN